MVSLVLLMTLFRSSSSQSGNCGWVIIEDTFQPLDFCQQEKAPDVPMSSYMISCNPNNDRIQAQWWRDSDTCGTDRQPDVISHPMTDTFNCNDTRCSSFSYVTYKTYLTDECVSFGHIITDNAQQPDAPIHPRSPFRETTLITNTCYNSTNSPYYSLITCTNDSYSIHSYHDAECSLYASTQVIERAECKGVSFCSHPSSIELPTTTESYFTTTPTPIKQCNFINNMGYNIPTDKCLTISSFESQSYACIGQEAIEWSYYSNGKCDGSALWSYVFPDVGILDMNCRDDICSDEEYMELILYKTEDDCGIDGISETDYESHLYVVNSCMITPDNEGIMYECTNNKEDASNAGYSVTTYADPQCLIAKETFVYSEVECMEEGRQHMVRCNGVNNISVPHNESDTTDYITDCNYFINHHQDALGRIGEPLDVCMSMQHGAGMYSKKYQCNATRNGIEEVVFHGEFCLEHNIDFIEPRPEFTMFYCESTSDCDAVLIGKQYTNETCERSGNVEQFWYDEYIIMDECWPIQSDLYAVMSCDANGFVYHSLYTHEQCTEDSLVSEHRFSGDMDCIYGKLFETMHCPHWSTTTQLPIITTEDKDSMETSNETETTTEIMTSTMEIESTQQEETTTETETTEETTTTSDIVMIPSTTHEEETGSDKGKLETSECVNVFGGGDLLGIKCNTWANILIALIVLLAAIISLFIAWCLCSNDTKSCRQWICGKSSNLHIANGNGHHDLQDIVVQQLNKGQHVQPAVLARVEEDEDEETDVGIDL
eukprot:19470_1